MKERAYFWRYWRITPDQYRSLTLGEYNAMVEVMKDEARRNRKAMNRGRKAS